MGSLLQVLNMSRNSQLRDTLADCMGQLFNTPRPIFDACWVENVQRGKLTGGGTGTNRPYWQPAADALFETWQATRDPAWLYTHEDYMWDSLGCSVYESCPAVGHGIQLIQGMGIEPKRIVDLGAGPGLTTLMLARAFPNAEVEYHEFGGPANPTRAEKVFLWFNQNVTRLQNIKHVSEPSGVYDIIVGMEYVEHLVLPNKPGVGDPMCAIDGQVTPFSHDKTKFLMHSNWSAEANDWTTLGHFLQYQFDGVTVPNTRASRYFKTAMAKRGWAIERQGFNACPLVFGRQTP